MKARLDQLDVRTDIDDRNEKIGKKIREGELRKIPYLLIVGEKEEGEGAVSVRRQGEGDMGSMSIDDFAKMINDEVKKMTEQDNE